MKTTKKYWIGALLCLSQMLQAQTADEAMEIQKRLDKVLARKTSFTPYEKKASETIVAEFDHLQTLRHELWKDKEDYGVTERLWNLGNDQWPKEWLAFAYNVIDDLEEPYNASRIWLKGYPFIALKEPVLATQGAFFKVLDKHADALVRLKPEGEYSEDGSFSYWSGRLKEEDGSKFLKVSDEGQIPYFFTNDWVDDQQIDVSKLYDLVGTVRESMADKDGPLAVHCAAGVGRTGTFITAYVLANLLDEMDASAVSVEELVLTLSVQRHQMVRSAEQYQLLYEFVDYYVQRSRQEKSVIAEDGSTNLETSLR